jgi:hypothetical protein
MLAFFASVFGNLNFGPVAVPSASSNLLMELATLEVAVSTNADVLLLVEAQITSSIYFFSG